MLGMLLPVTQHHLVRPVLLLRKVREILAHHLKLITVHHLLFTLTTLRLTPPLRLPGQVLLLIVILTRLVIQSLSMFVRLLLLVRHQLATEANGVILLLQPVIQPVTPPRFDQTAIIMLMVMWLTVMALLPRVAVRALIQH